MAERRLLSESFVDNAQPPDNGERWIADTAVCGFGIRLWGGKTKGKSFALRVADQSGRIVRRTIVRADGYLLSIARDIARKEIGQLKGSKKTAASREKWRRRIQEMTVDDLAKLALTVQERSCSSAQYVFDNRSRYFNHASPAIGSRKAMDITANDLVAILTPLDDKPAQARNLRSFFSYMFTLAAEFEPQFYRPIHRLRRIYQTPYHELLIPILNLKESDFDLLFQILKNYPTEQQKADFIHLLFFLGAKVRARRLLRAQWKEFHDGFWYSPRKTPERTWISRRRLEDEALDLLRSIREQNEDICPGSPFVFPSTRARKTGHMSSYRAFWESVRNASRLPNAPLHELIAHYDFVVLWPRSLARMGW